MIGRILILGSLTLLLACEQESQPLPFDPAGESSAMVNADGGVVSTAAGASIDFPSGSLPGNLQVTIAPATLPAALSGSGTAVSAAFRIDPTGTELASPASVELRFDPDADDAQGWLASVVGVANGEVREYGATRVDLATGIARAEIDQLATFAVVIPEASAIHPVLPRSAAAQLPSVLPAVLPGQTTRSVAADCGQPGDRCAGLGVAATNNLLEQVDAAAVVFPKVRGVLSLSASGVSGSLRASASVRVRLQNGRTAETVQVEALIEPTATSMAFETATQLLLTDMRHRVGGGSVAGSVIQEHVGTVVIPKSAGNGAITIERSFPIRVTGGATETAAVSIAVPVELHP